MCAPACVSVCEQTFISFVLCPASSFTTMMSLSRQKTRRRVPTQRKLINFDACSVAPFSFFFAYLSWSDEKTFGFGCPLGFHLKSTLEIRFGFSLETRWFILYCNVSLIILSTQLDAARRSSHRADTGSECPEDHSDGVAWHLAFLMKKWHQLEWPRASVCPCLCLSVQRNQGEKNVSLLKL